MTSKSQSKTEKKFKYGTSSKSTMFAVWRTPVGAWKGKLEAWRKYLQTMYLTEDSYLELYKELLKVSILKYSIKNGQKTLTDMSVKRFYKWQNKYMKRCSTS